MPEARQVDRIIPEATGPTAFPPTETSLGLPGTGSPCIRLDDKASDRHATP
jgi:hypothetical protein